MNQESNTARQSFFLRAYNSVQDKSEIEEKAKYMNDVVWFTVASVFTGGSNEAMQYGYRYMGGHDPGPYCNTTGILPHWIIGRDIAIRGGGLWAGLSEPWSTVGIIWLEAASRPDNVIQRITCTCCGHSG
ncbi:hypothetical protein K435DRAFT_876316 [Dendrothele bispora CBS 962.96]|uniref:Uncharacterized protein n=1 Tax=Dendrothele bispora (strain CBS 962.96) TaxID=1314807 RepID=A0A4S8KSD6_DENBC|nr:hypothetical protein K435DRAFT_876316 [Dendrothele bispora CBS 962.96]